MAVSLRPDFLPHILPPPPPLTAGLCGPVSRPPLVPALGARLYLVLPLHVLRLATWASLSLGQGEHLHSAYLLRGSWP